MTLFLFDRHEINKYTVGLVLDEYKVNWKFNEPEEGSEIYDLGYDFTLNMSTFICYINLATKTFTRFIKEDSLNDREFENIKKEYKLKIENVGALRSVIKKLTGDCKYNSDGKWAKFYNEYQNVFSEHRRDSGVGKLLHLLNQSSFPLLPSDLDYDDISEYHKHFTLFWTGRFFIQFPFHCSTSLITLVSTTGGPFIKFKTVEEMADHLIDNILFYQK